MSTNLFKKHIKKRKIKWLVLKFGNQAVDSCAYSLRNYLKYKRMIKKAMRGNLYKLVINTEVTLERVSK